MDETVTSAVREAIRALQAKELSPEDRTAEALVTLGSILVSIQCIHKAHGLSSNSGQGFFTVCHSFFNESVVYNDFLRHTPIGI